MLQSELCDYSNEYIVVSKAITFTNSNNGDYDKKLVFENTAPFINYVLKINNIFIDKSEDLDIVMPMYNLIEYSKIFSNITESLWNYYRDEPSTVAEGNRNYSIKDSKSFDYKPSITGKLQNDIVGK